MRDRKRRLLPVPCNAKLVVLVFVLEAERGLAGAVSHCLPYATSGVAFRQAHASRIAAAPQATRPMAT